MTEPAPAPAPAPAPLSPALETLAGLVASGYTWADAARDAGVRSPDWRVLCRDRRLTERVAAIRAGRVAKILDTPPAITPERLRAIFEGQGTFDPVVFESVESLADLRAKVPEDLRRLLVKGWRFDKAGRFVLDLCDKDTALDRLARHHGFYNDKVTVKHTGFHDLLAAAEQALDLS